MLFVFKKKSFFFFLEQNLLKQKLSVQTYRFFYMEFASKSINISPNQESTLSAHLKY